MSDEETKVQQTSGENGDVGDNSISGSRNSRRNSLVHRTTFQWVLIAITLIAVWLFFDGRQLFTNDKDKYSVSEPTLSPDNNKIIFSIREKGGLTNIGVYELSTGKISKMNPTGKSCLSPIYSSDGKMITFVQREKHNANVFVMNANGTAPRQVTHTNNKEGETDPSYGSLPVYRINALPSFSPDGQKIIYLQSRVQRKRSMGGEMISGWHLHEVILATGKQKQLTDFRFYSASRPYYLRDRQGFIFSASGAKGDIPDEMQPKNDNEILIMDGQRPYPCRAFEHETYAVEPSISDKGHIIFVSRTNGYDGTTSPYTYDIFMRKDNKTQRITFEKFPATIKGLPYISLDGSLVVFLASKSRNESPGLWIAKTDGTETKLIGRPWTLDK